MTLTRCSTLGNSSLRTLLVCGLHLKANRNVNCQSLLNVAIPWLSILNAQFVKLPFTNPLTQNSAQNMHECKSACLDTCMCSLGTILKRLLVDPVRLKVINAVEDHRAHVSILWICLVCAPLCHVQRSRAWLPPFKLYTKLIIKMRTFLYSTLPQDCFTNT